MRSIVSLLWPETVRVAVCPERVFASGAGHPVQPSGERPWTAAAQALLPLLSSLGVRRARVSITLSNRFARFVALPFSPALNTEAAWQAFAARRFEDLHGVKPGIQSILVSPAERGSTRIGCAVDRDLVETIRSLLQSAGHRLVNLKPHFAAAFNLARRRFSGRDGWFVSQEPGQLTLGLAVSGGWSLVRQRRVGDDWADELPGMLRREAQMAGLPTALETIHVADIDSVCNAAS